MKQVILVLILYIFFPQVVHSGICEDYATRTHWSSTIFPSNSSYIRSTGYNWPWHYVALRDGTMDVIDIQNPRRPVVVNNFELPCTFNWMAVDGDLAMGGNWGGNLFTLDLSDPLHPVVRDELVIPEYAYSPILTGNRAWVNTSSNEIMILDTTLGAGLEILGRWPYESYFDSMLEHEGLAYIIIDGDLFIMDFSDPEAPQQVAIYSDFGYYMAFAGDIMVVSINNQIFTYDTSNPSSLVLLDTMTTEMYDYRLFCSDNLVFANPGSDPSMNLFSVSDSGVMGDGMTHLSQTGYQQGEVFFSDEHFYSCSNNVFNIIAIGDESVAEELAFKNAPADLDDMVIVDEYGFATAEWHGLCVFDLSDPTDPLIAGSGFTSYEPTVISATDDLVILAGHNGFSIFNVSNPTLPVLEGVIDNLLGFYPHYIALQNKTAWLGNMTNPAIVVDFSDASNPVQIFTSEIYAEQMTIDQGLLHAVDFDGLYTIYSLETLPPQEIGQIQLATFCADLAVDGDRILVSHEYNGISLVDISDPTSPILLDHQKIVGGVYSVSLNGEQALITSYDLTTFIRIDENNKFQAAGTIWEGGWGHNILADGEVLIRGAWLTEHGAEFAIYPAPCFTPTAVPDPIYVGNGTLVIFPNPFNPTTTISFELEKTGRISLRIYDLTGRLVNDLLADDVVTAGSHSWSWNGRDMDGRAMSSGIYLVQLKGEGIRASGRMALVR